MPPPRGKKRSGVFAREESPCDASIESQRKRRLSYPDLKAEDSPKAVSIEKKGFVSEVL